MSGILKYKLILNYTQWCSEFKIFKANININIQITIHVSSLPWHSGKVLESIGNKSLPVRPEWPHRQCVGVAFWSRTFAADSVQQVLWFAARIAECNTWSSGGTALCRVGGATSQLDPPSLTPLSVAGCGWLQLGAPPLGYFGNYCK